MIGLLALAAQLSIVAHAPDSAAVCDAIEVTVAVSAPGRQPPRLITPSFAPFDVLRSSTVPHVTVQNGGAGILAEYRFVLTTDRAGAYTLPAFAVQRGTEIVRSRPVDIVVRGSALNRPVVVARARIDTSLEVKFRAITQPETVYVGQQANYEVAVFLNETVRDRLRRNPTFFPPDMQSMLAYDLPSRPDQPRRQGSSHCFDALVYQRALFPLMPGRFAIPPAQLVYSLPLSASFFSREETHELETDSTIVVAVSPPLAGRPADFGGAVGRLRVAAKLDTVGSRVGDPMMLTVRVSGTGNVKLFPRPVVGVPWATLVKGDERVDVDTTAYHIGGAKEFDWVLTPKIAGELDLPPIRYSYFDPEARRYEVAATAPTHVRIGAGTLASADTARTEVLLSLRTRYRGAPGTPLHQHPLFWVVLALVPLPALHLRRRERVRRAGARPVAPGARLAATAGDAAAARDACGVRRVFTSALGERLSLDPESFTRVGGLARALRRRGVSTDVALEAEQFLRELDEAAFSASGRIDDAAAQRAYRLYGTIDREALPRLRIRRTALGIVGLFAIGVATAHAANVVIARRAFDAGVAAYGRHEFAAARDAFIQSVLADPAAPDAWANLGTAAWAGADTARSVVAWQRALRIEPFATDVRERAELAHALPIGSAGYVPPLSDTVVFIAAALLWCAAWGMAARHAWRGERDDGRALAVAAVLAAILAVGGFVLTDRLSGRNLAVVRHTAPLRDDPELSADPGPTAIVGEVVRVDGRQGAWTRVVLDDGRQGWAGSADLLSLDARDAAQSLIQ